MNRNGCILGSIVTCYVGVSLHSMTYIYIWFMKYSNGTSAQLYAYTSMRACFLCIFYSPYNIMSCFNS